MAFLFGPTVRDGICLLVREACAGAKIEVWNSAAYDDTKLAELTMGTPAFVLPVNGTITSTSISPTTVLATGNAAAWRIVSAVGDVILTGSMGGPDSDADWTLETADALLLQNQTLALNSFVYTAPL